MTDVAVYYFMRRSAPHGEQLLSRRRAVLDAIKGRGRVVMQSRRVVDHTEVDENGFLIGGPDDQPVNEMWSRIRSLESRARSRDREALEGAGAAKGERIARLLCESTELRREARGLRDLVYRVSVKSA